MTTAVLFGILSNFSITSVKV